MQYYLGSERTAALVCCRLTTPWKSSAVPVPSCRDKTPSLLLTKESIIAAEGLDHHYFTETRDCSVSLICLLVNQTLPPLLIIFVPEVHT